MEPIPDQTIAEVLPHVGTMNLKVLAARFGVDHKMLYRRLKRMGVQTPKKVPHLIDTEQVRSLLEAGLTHGDIAARLGVSISAIHRTASGKGLKTARTGPRSGQAHRQKWAGGRILDKHGYVLIWCPLHPKSRGVGYVYEHRLLMEVILGRYLGPAEVVNHEDNHPRHNWPENLSLFASNADHLRYELTGRVKATPRRSIPGAYLSTEKLDRCPEEQETLALCPSSIRGRLDQYIAAHRPTTAHQSLPRRAFLRQGAHRDPFPSETTG